MSILEKIISIDHNAVNARRNICLMCEFHFPETEVETTHIDAISGETLVSVLTRLEQCSKDHAVNFGYLKLKAAVCPEGKW